MERITKAEREIVPNLGEKSYVTQAFLHRFPFVGFSPGSVAFSPRFIIGLLVVLMSFFLHER